METNDHIKILFGKHIAGTLNATERQQLAELAEQYSDEVLITVLESIAEATPKDAAFTMNDWEAVLTAVLKHPPVSQRPAPVVRLRVWKKIAVAAAIVLAIGLGAYFLFFNKEHKPAEVVTAPLPADIKAPENNRATITLANGQKVYLDSSSNGQLAMQGNIQLVKLADGQVAYQSSTGEAIKEIQYNTLHNPRGSKVIDMMLSDGSHVWLNAGSSITYPVAFASGERKVKITGEAYFEVAHFIPSPPPRGEAGRSVPFIVSKGDVQVQVLGTHFNMNAYDDEASIKVTLLEGSVKVNDKIIKPGQQARVASEITIVNNIDLEDVMAWKNGKFIFNVTDVQTAMRQLARWYDVDVEYRGNVKGFFKGSIERKENVSQVLKMLELTDEVHFEMQGRKIIVKP